MFKNLSTSSKLLILCTAFLIAVGVPVYALVMEKRIAIDFARKELVGSRYLATVREIYAAVLPIDTGGERFGRPDASSVSIVKALAGAESTDGARLQTAELARALAATLRGLSASKAEGGNRDALLLDALEKAQMLAQRIGDDSNLALDPDLDSYYMQRLVASLLPIFVGRLTQLRQAFEASVAPGSPPMRREVRLPVLVSLLRSTASEVQHSLEAAYRGNPDGSLKQAVGGEFAEMILRMDAYLGALAVGTGGNDAGDRAARDDSHVRALKTAIGAWASAQSELDRLVQRRIDGLLGRMRLELALIAAFAGLSLCIAVLTHRRIVGSLRRLEAVATKVRMTEDYSLRADCSSQDEIGRVAAAFNGMLSELAVAREREAAERAELARATRLTAMAEMAASIAHEVNQPLAAIVSSGNAGLRWLANETPDLGRVGTVLQRIVRDGLRASGVVGSIRTMFRKGMTERVPVDVSGLIADVLAHLHGELQSERISVQVELADRLPKVLADRVQLQQVLINLMTNGIDAMRSVDDRLRQLRVGAKVVEADGVIIGVGDTGLGIDPKMRDRIFDPFFTTKTSGMGLGLSICRSIVEAHGGRVWASPGTPYGTVFRLMLPSHDADGA